jgi:uncharacterized protein (TIGR02145 family)
MGTLRENFAFKILLLSIITIFNNGCKKESDKELIINVTTSPIKNITKSSALSGGEIWADVSSPVISRGVCWGTSTEPTIDNNKTDEGSGVGVFTSQITGLASNTTYYVRAYATNNEGTGYGAQITFKTIGPVTDIDGNIYQTISIGNKVWMVENLKTTKYSNGDPIQLVTDVNLWGGIESGAYCNYDNNAINSNTYGHLYNRYAIKDTRGICPVGWRIPSVSDWEDLAYYLGGKDVAGGKLKETGISHWNSPNGGATNEIGFSALPNGYLIREAYVRYEGIGYTASFWSSSTTSTGSPPYYDNGLYFFTLSNWSTGLTKNSRYFQYLGWYGIRCVKNNY